MSPAAESRELIVTRAGGRCENCQMHQSLQGATFHIEHVIPRTLGGASELNNVALACPSCNLHKADRISVPTGLSDEVVALFNPRLDSWNQHFEWGDYILVGKSQIGRATILALDLNHERRIRIRQAEQLFGLFPPDHTKE